MWSFIHTTVWTAVFSQFLCFAVSQSVPQVNFVRIALRFTYTNTRTERHLTEVYSEVESSGFSDAIVGTNLWTSELYVTRQSDGLKWVVDDQLLSSDQASMASYPGTTLRFSSDVRVNIGNLDAFTHFCVKFYKNPAAFPDYIFSYGASDHITACRAIKRVGTFPQHVPQQRSDIRLGYYNVGYQYETAISSSGRPSVYLTRVVVDSFTQPDSQSVNFYNAWQLRLFLNSRRNGTGPRLTLSDQLLDVNQASKFVGPNQHFSFVANRRVSLSNYGPGTSFPYVCAELRTTSSRYMLNFNGRQSAVSCSLITQAPEEIPISSYDAQIRFSRPDPNLRMALARVTYVVGFNMSSSVTGSSLWQLKMFASENEDGTGRNRSVSEQILSSNQMSVDAVAGGQFTLQTTKRFDIEGLGADNGLPYMCVAFTKHHRSPLNICFQGDSVITSCEPIPQGILQLPDPRAIVSDSRIQLRFNQTSLYDGVVNTAVKHYVTFSHHSDDIEGGTPLWVLRLFASQNSLATGYQRELASQLLDEEQMAFGVSPGAQLVFTGEKNINFTGIGPGTYLPYICVSLEKNPDAETELLFGRGNAVLGCQALPRFHILRQPQQQSFILLRSYDVGYQYETAISSSGRPSVYLTRVTVDAATQPTSQSVRAYNAWRLRLFLNSRQDGSAPRLTLSNQLLDSNQASTFVGPNQQFSFEADRLRLNLFRHDPGTSFPYVCAELTTTSLSPYMLDFDGRRSAVSCSLIKQPSREVIISSHDAQITFSRTNLHSGQAVADVTYNVGFNMSSPAVTGDSLWQLKMFASENEDGTGRHRTVSEQILDPMQMSVDAIAGRPFTLRAAKRFDIEGLGADNGLPYMCFAFTKHQLSPVYINFQGDSIITSCEPIPQEIVELPDPRAIVRHSQIDLSFNQTSSYDAMVHTTVKHYVTFSRYSNAVEGGTPLWVLRLFASQNSLATGYQRELASQLLDEEQMAFGVSPGEQLVFTGEKSINFTGIGPGTRLPYICVSLEKNPDAEMELLVGRKNAAVGCQDLPRFHVLPRPLQQSSIQLKTYNVGYQYETATSSSGRPSLYLTQVAVDAITQPTSQTVDAHNAWQLRLYLNSRQDGSGPRITLSNQLLDSNQASTFVGPNQQFSFASNRRFNVNNHGPGTSFPYVCAELTTTSSSPYMLNFNGRQSAVSCSLITQEPEQPADPRAIVSGSHIELSFNQTNLYDGVVNTAVKHYVTFNDYSDAVEGGMPLWVLRLFASQNSLASGYQRELASQLLDEEQMAFGVSPGEQLVFTGEKSINFTGIGPGTHLPYICVSLEKTPDAEMELAVGRLNAVVGCEVLPRFHVLPRPLQQPSIQLKTYNVGYQYETATSSSGRPSLYLTQVAVDAITQPTSQTVDAHNAWQLRLYLNSRQDGSGPRITLSNQLLDSNQASTFVRPNQQFSFASNRRFNVNNYGPGTFPYVCAELTTTSSSPYMLNFNGRQSAVSCSLITQEPEQPADPRAIVSSSHIELSFNQTNLYDGVVNTAVKHYVTFNNFSDAVEGGTPLWVLRLFASQNSLATGYQRELASQLLDEEQMAFGVSPGEQLVFTGEKSINFTGIGPGTHLPYICVSLEKTPDAEMELALGRLNAIVGCEVLPRFHVLPRPLQQRSIQLKTYNVGYQYETATSSSGRPSLYLTQVAVDAITQPTSQTVDAHNAWQLRLYLNSRQDGSGPRITLSNQLLDSNQASTFVRPNQQFSFASNRRFNVNNHGPGTSFPYVCAELTTTSSSPYMLNFNGRQSAVSCSLITQEPEQPADPRAIVSGSHIELSFNQTNLYYGVVNTAVKHYVTFNDYSDAVEGGTPLWVLRLFASQNSLATGYQRELASQLLDEEQMAFGVSPGEQLVFTGEKSINFTGIGPGTHLPYICVSLEKTPDAEMELAVGRLNAVVGCEVLPRFRIIPQPRQPSSILLRSYNVGYQYETAISSSGRPSVYLTRVAIDAITQPTSQTVDANNAWQLRLFLNSREDGSGPRRILSNQLLDSNQASKFVGPNQQFSFEANRTFNVNNHGPGTSFPYVCTELTTTSSSPYMLNLHGRRSAVTCSLIKQISNERLDNTPEAVISSARVQSRFSDGDRYDAFFDVALNYFISFGSSSDVIEGDSPLWMLKLVASENSDGSGSQRELSRQLLNNEQMRYRPLPRQSVVFRVTKRVNYTGIDATSDYPHICVVLETNPNANVRIVYRDNDTNSVTICQVLPTGVIPLVPDETRQANVAFANAEFNFLEDTDLRDDMLPINVVYDILFSGSSDYIGGRRRPLWVMRLFTSQYANGTGNQRQLSSQLLDDEHMTQGVTPRAHLQLEGETRVNSADIGAISDYPYICAALETNPDAEVALVFGNENSVTLCQEIPSSLQETPPTTVVAEPEVPQAIVYSASVRYTFLNPNTEDAYINASVHYDVFFDSRSEVVEGGMPLWLLRLFASENPDGSGSQRELSAQLLDDEQMSQGISPGSHLQFSSRRVINSNEIGDHTGYPYICTELRTNTNADVELFHRSSSSAVNCERLPPFLPVPDPTFGASMRQQFPVEQQNSKLTLRQFDLTSDSVDATAQYLLMLSPSVDGHTDTVNNPRWQLRLFASQNSDGTGSTRSISPQILDDEQEYSMVQPGESISFTRQYSFDAEGMGSDTSLPYICSSLSAHPEADFDLLNGDGDAITTCSELILETVPAESTCRIWGDPHQKTFDGYGYSFQDVGKYVAVETCEDGVQTVPRFRLLFETLRLRPSVPVSYIYGFQLEYSGVVYALNHPNEVLVDGVTVTLPFTDDNNVNIHYAAPHQILTTDFGLAVRLDESHNSDITLTDQFEGKVCGLCGNYDTIRGNECHYRNGTMMLQHNEDCKIEFVNEWNVERSDLPYPEHIKDFRPCEEGSPLMLEASSNCGILTDPTGPLASCHPYISPDLYYENCIFDLCQLLPSALFLCGSVEAYIYECSQVAERDVHVGDWRNHTSECEPTCPENMVFNARGNACPPTCADPDGIREDCPVSFLESCQCVHGMVLDGTKCVNRSSCGCKMANGQYLSVGEESMTSDCSEVCSCDGADGLRCNPVNCARNAVCDIKAGTRNCYCQEGFNGDGRELCRQQDHKTCRIYGDPHFLTFDDVFYSFQGGCLYTAVHTCKPLPSGTPKFRIVIKNERLIPEERYTYITVVQLRISGKTYKLTYTGRASLDNVPLNGQLPYVDPETGIRITSNQSSLHLETPFGVVLTFNVDNALSIRLPATYYGKVCGLCGNADGSNTNDKMLPDGTLGKKLAFANSWSFGQCVPLDEPVESCREGSDEYAEAVDMCNEIIKKDGPFAHCHDYQDPLPFFQSCVFDLCGSLPDNELFCTSVNQYLEACADKGARSDFDWKKDVPACAPINCPEGYTPFKRSCYKLWRIRENFENSRLHCEREGGHLATVTSRLENEFVSDLAERKRSWIGAVRNFSASFRRYESPGIDSYAFLPERIQRGIGSIQFSVSAGSDAYIILSPTMEPGEHTPVYEIAIGTERNTRNFIRRCIGCPEEDSERERLLRAGKEKRFYVNFHGGRVRMGRFKSRDINLEFIDEDPFRVHYIGFKTVGEVGTWKFFENEMKWITSERWSFDNYRYGEPSNYNGLENCLETNFDSRVGAWNDHFCDYKKPFVCEI